MMTWTVLRGLLEPRSAALSLTPGLAARSLGASLMLLVAATSWGATYYVAAGGSNAGAGTLASPWATPGYGSRQLQPGDTLVIRGGRYVLAVYDDDIIVPPSGTASAWITIQGEAGNRPVLAGRDNLLSAVDLAGKSYVRVENLEITHDAQASGEGIWFREAVSIVGPPASNLVIANLYVHHIDEFGLDAQDVDGLEIVDSRFEYCGFGALGGPAAAQGGWRNVTIRRSDLSWSGHYYRGGNRAPYDRPDGFGIEASGGPIEIVDSRAEHNYGDGLDSKAQRTTIRRCIVANNSSDGVKLWGGGSRIENTVIYGRGDGAPTGPWAAIVIDSESASGTFEIVNVTVDDALGLNYIMYVQYGLATPIDLVVRNSIFRGTGPDCPVYVGGAVNLTFDHNLLYLPATDSVLSHGDAVYTAANIASLGTGNRYGDPLYVAPAWGTEGDYHLQAGSPAIGTGSTAAAPTDDLEGTPRDASIDMGAYEYHGAAGCGSTCLVYLVPAVAHAPGAAGTTWRTDLAVVNLSGAPANFTLTYNTAIDVPVARSTSLANGATREWIDVLVSLFGFSAAAETSGAVQIASDTPLFMTSRVYNQATTGTFGQSLPALTLTDALSAGETGVLPQLRKSPAFRTNLGLANVGTVACAVLVKLFNATGAPVGTAATIQVLPGAWTQEFDIFTSTGAGNQSVAYATLEVQTVGGKVWAYASVIDEATGDPATVPLLIRRPN